MKNVISCVVVILVVSASGFTQTENTAPVVWERYRDSGAKVSVHLPKLPTVLRFQDGCAEVESVTYRAYAEGAAYEVTTWAHKSGIRPNGCTARIVTRFDRKSFEERVDTIQHQRGFGGRSATTVAGLEGYRFSSANATRVVVLDEPNKRWIALEVMHYPDAVPNLDRFFDSLEIGDASGKEIGDGSAVTLGDEGTLIVAPVLPAPVKSGDLKPGSGNGPGLGAEVPIKAGTSYTMVAKEKAGYTAEARRANVQGAVRLKVTLLANGAVGSVVVVKDQPHGLTESAINTARRLVFLPKRVEGKPVTVIVTMEYSFSIY